MSRVSVWGRRFITPHFIKKHPYLSVTVGHLGIPRNESRPFIVYIEPAGQFHGGFLAWHDEVSWETAVGRCVELAKLGVPLEKIRLHGSSIRQEKLQEDIKKAMGGSGLSNKSCAEASG